MTVHIWIEVVGDGFMNKMVLGAWAVWTGGNTRGGTRGEKNPVNMGLRLGACVPRSQTARRPTCLAQKGHVVH